MNETAVATAEKQTMSDLWAAVSQAAPEVVAVMKEHPPVRSAQVLSHPGLREFLMVEFALGTPNTLIKDKLNEIAEEQMADGVPVPWPMISKQRLDELRREYSPEWQVIRARIEQNIEHVGIISKKNRLMALQQLAEELSSRMWSERNEKSGELYLQGDYIRTLKAAAEEMGDLGRPAEQEVEGLIEIARALANVVNVQGSGLQDRGAEVYDYDKGEFVKDDRA